MKDQGEWAGGHVATGSIGVGDRVRFPDGRIYPVLAFGGREGSGIRAHRLERLNILLPMGVDLRHGQLMLEVLPPGPEVVEPPIMHTPGNTVGDLTFIGVRYVDAFCERDREIGLDWITPSHPPNEGGVATKIQSVTLFARVFCFAPEDTPDDFDNLDPENMRHVISTFFKVA